MCICNRECWQTSASAQYYAAPSLLRDTGPDAARSPQTATGDRITRSEDGKTMGEKLAVGDLSQKELMDEIRKDPVGQRNPLLQRMVNCIRNEPTESKLAVLCTKPRREWLLIRMNGRGKPVTFIGEKFTDINDADWAVFRARMRRYFGIELPPARSAGKERQ